MKEIQVMLEQAKVIAEQYWWITSILVPSIAPIIGGLATYFAIRSIEDKKADDLEKKSVKLFYSELEVFKHEVEDSIRRVYLSIEMQYRDKEPLKCANYTAHSFYGLNNSYRESAIYLPISIRRSFLSLDTYNQYCSSFTERLVEAFKITSEDDYVTFGDGSRSNSLDLRGVLNDILSALSHVWTILQRMLQLRERYDVKLFDESREVVEAALKYLNIDFDENKISRSPSELDNFFERKH